MSPDINQFKHKTKIQVVNRDQMSHKVKSAPRPLSCSRTNMLRLEESDWAAVISKFENVYG